MNSRDRHYFADTSMENFIEKIITKPDFEEFPNRSFGESRKLKGRSTTVSIWRLKRGLQQTVKTLNRINHLKFCDSDGKVGLSSYMEGLEL